MAHPRIEFPRIPSRRDYRLWAEAQPRGRVERVAGEVVSMAPERGAPLRVKAAVWLALRQAIRAAGLSSCEALPDGATVEVGNDTDYEPDAIVNRGERMGDDAVATPNPVIVVEVPSPSTRSVDTGAKLVDYFRVLSIHHCLIVRADRRAVIHHRHREDGGIETRIVVEGALVLDPPGLRLVVEDFHAV